MIVIPSNSFIDFMYFRAPPPVPQTGVFAVTTSFFFTFESECAAVRIVVRWRQAVWRAGGGGGIDRQGRHNSDKRQRAPTRVQEAIASQHRGLLGGRSGRASAMQA